MAAPATFSALDPTTTKASVVRGRKTFIALFSQNVRTNIAANASKCLGVFCAEHEMSEPSFAAIIDQTTMAPGKAPYQQSEGTSYEFTVTLKGGAAGVMRTLLDTAATQNANLLDYNLSSQKFGIVVYQYTDADTVVTTVYRNLDATLQSTSGVSYDSEGFINVKFRCEDTTGNKPIQTKAGQMWVAEHFYDDGASIVNAAAPDGAIVAFTLGDGNGSYTLTTPTPVALIYDSNQSTPFNYVQVWVDGIEQKSGFTFNAGTSVLTFAVAPADGAKLVIGYVCLAFNSGSGVAAPLFDAPTTAEEQIPYGWNQFNS